MRRLGFPILICLLLVASAPGVAAQSQREVDRRQADAEVAEAEVAATLARQDVIVAELNAALGAYAQVGAAAWEMVGKVSERRADVEAAEKAVGKLRLQVRAAITDAYFDAFDGAGIALIATKDMTDLLVSQDLATRIAARELELLEQLEAEKAALARIRAEFDPDMAALTQARHDAESLLRAIAELAVEADRNAFAAGEASVAAQAAYEAAILALEAADQNVGPKVARWRPLVEQFFPEPLIWEALRVIQCESRGTPDAVNPISDASGLFQFLAGTWEVASARAGYAGADRFDPEANVASAAWLVANSQDHPNGRWGHWACRHAA